MKFIITIAALALCLSGCASTLPNDHHNKSYHFQEAHTGTSWHLWWQNGGTVLRGHSQGYVLSPIDPANQTELSWHSKAENARYIGPADGARLEVLKMYEFGMQQPTTRATGIITMPDGKEYPCEIHWYPYIKDSLKLL